MSDGQQSNVQGGALDGAYLPPPTKPGIRWVMFTTYGEDEAEGCEHVVYAWLPNRKRWVLNPEIEPAKGSKR